MKKVYCDSGAYTKILKKLEKDGKIKLLYHPYENKNSKIDGMSLPSESTWNDMKMTWDECVFTWDEFSGSEKVNELKDIIGLSNRVDILHLDSAYKSKCDFFVTSDKGDIYSKKDEIFKLLNIVVCLHTEITPETFLDIKK